MIVLRVLVLVVCAIKAEALSGRSVPAWVQKAGGLKFDCTGCGDCCKVSGDVWLSSDEVVDIAATLGLTLEDFEQRHTDVSIEAGGYKRLTSSPKGCTFLTRCLC